MTPLPPPSRIRARSGPLAAGLALMMACAGLAGCSGPDSPAEACTPYEVYGTFDGDQVTVVSAFTGVEAERFEASLVRFEGCTGIDVVHTGSTSLEADLLAASGADTATASGATPAAKDRHQALADLAIIPQQGLVTEMVDTGVVQPLPEAVNANVELGWDRQWAQAGTYDSVPYAAPLMASVKSLIWYSPQAFSQAGYEVPTTWAELQALTKRIRADHPDGAVAPWCLGVADGEATGWVMTDWLEEALLATQGPGTYDAWWEHKIPVDDSAAVGALEEVESLVLAPGHVLGGREGALAMTPEDAGAALVEGRCLMLHASSSFEGQLPAGTAVADASGTTTATVPGAPQTTASAQEGTDRTGALAPSGAAVDTSNTVTAFTVPDSQENSDAVMVGTDYVLAFSRGPAQEAVLTYLSTDRWAQARVELGGVATANRGVDASTIPSAVARQATVTLQSRETTMRIDASDRMPVDVGTGALWKGLTQWLSGEVTAKEALGQAESAWPS
ncbi:ABC transporter substrate-binding protein [Actinomyces slackii]|uniref:Carbohydrate ABC transporter, N-acetylglucosamine /diacetylchitobiose-binding protein n=1 Tax=Actinomyces slackii TaxID=52774 RepID=A0A448KA23_9ACTO|nr:ABC transporter substrate-binding protein [Actinomyces slackii]VEG73775.1 carbohydrate ABC transporter, N-acetylglucosamine /diacetylchitobiose-binding protein [Actinomyces slackii]